MNAVTSDEVFLFLTRLRAAFETDAEFWGPNAERAWRLHESRELCGAFRILQREVSDETV